MGRLLLGIFTMILVGCSNANVSVSGLKGPGITLNAVPGYDVRGPVSSVVNGTFTVKGKVDSYTTAAAINGTFTVTGEVIR